MLNLARCKLFFSFFAAALFFVTSSALYAQNPGDSASSSGSAVASDSGAAQKLHVPGVRNAGKVSDFLYRGAQPSRDGFVELRKLGVTTVVNLRKSSHEKESERWRVESLGMRYITIPVSGWAAPTNAQVAQFLELLQESQGQKIFVHCRFGDDRTGVMIAAYRLALQHWSTDQAIKEMYDFGFHHHWHPSMESYVQHLSSNLATDPTFNAIRQQPAKN